MRAIPLTAEPATRLRFGVAQLIASMAFLAIGFMALRPAIDPDYGWHVANGRHLLDGVLLGGRDPYSWTAAGAPWIAHEWLTDGAMAFLHDMLGPTANSMATALLSVVAFSLVWARLRGRGYAVGVGAAVTVLAAVAAYVSMGVRPQVLELVYLAAAVLLVDRWLAGTLTTRRTAVMVVAGMLLWANTHGSFVLGPAVLACAAAALLVAGDRRAVTGAALAILAAAIPVLNPWGIALYGFAAESIGSQTAQRVILEWQPPDTANPGFVPFFAELALLAGGAFIAGARRFRRSGWPALHDRHAVAPATTTAILLSTVLAFLGLRSGRLVMLLGIASAPLLAAGVSEAMAVIAGSNAAARLRARLAGRARPGGAPDADERGRTLVNLAVVAVFAVALAALAWPKVGPAGQDEAIRTRYPAGLLPAVDRLAAADATSGRPLRLFNAYEYGGYLLMERPTLRVSIDGRSEVYGDAQLLRYAEVTGRVPGWEEQIAAMGPNAALLPLDNPLVGAFRGLGWREIEADQVATLLLAPGGTP